MNLNSDVILEYIFRDGFSANAVFYSLCNVLVLHFFFIWKITLKIWPVFNIKYLSGSLAHEAKEEKL